MGEALGEVKDVDLDNGWVQVVLDGFKPICFETLVEFDSGEETLVSLWYERHFGFCRKCYSLCQDQSICPLRSGHREGIDGVLPDVMGKDKGMMSYKGAIANGIKISERMEHHPVSSALSRYGKQRNSRNPKAKGKDVVEHGMNQMWYGNVSWQGQEQKRKQFGAG